MGRTPSEVLRGMDSGELAFCLESVRADQDDMNRMMGGT